MGRQGHSIWGKLGSVIATLPAIVTIGNFDGFHRGHQHLIRQVVDRARVLGLPACAVTFDPHPRAVLRPHEPLHQLTPIREKVKLLRLAGIQNIWVCEFTPELAKLDAPEFLNLVQARWPLAELWVGADFALGRARSGSQDVLRRLGFEQGWRLQVVAPLHVAGEPVSSTRIRTLLDKNRHAEATSLLGRAAPTIAR
ncbi:MAG TPA: FAD synthetase family protein [Chloroflexota bacterium]